MLRVRLNTDNCSIDNWMWWVKNTLSCQTNAFHKRKSKLNPQLPAFVVVYWLKTQGRDSWLTQDSRLYTLKCDMYISLIELQIDTGSHTFCTWYYHVSSSVSTSRWITFSAARLIHSTFSTNRPLAHGRLCQIQRRVRTWPDTARHISPFNRSWDRLRFLALAICVAPRQSIASRYYSILLNDTAATFRKALVLFLQQRT